VISTNPSFAFLKPWYLSTFSITSSTYNLQGTFSPGFCPGHIENNIYDFYDIQEAFQSFFSSSSESVISFVGKPNDNGYLNTTHQDSDGIVPLSDDREIDDSWFSTYKDYKSDVQYEKNEISGKLVIIATLALSFVGAFLIGLTGFMLFKIGVIAISKKIIRNSLHNNRYSRFVNEKENPANSRTRNRPSFDHDTGG